MTAPLPPPVMRCWASLPRDILLHIFLEVGHRNILCGAGFVCAAWWRAARDEPALWRRIDLMPRSPDDEDLCDAAACYPFAYYTIFDEIGAAEGSVTNKMAWEQMACAAIDRSAGQCEAFSGRGNDDVLVYLADRAPSLKSICITCHYDVSSHIFVYIVKRLPLLKEIELVLNLNDYCKGICNHIEPSTNNCWAELLFAACETCSHLNRFTVRRAGGRVPDDFDYGHDCLSAFSNLEEAIPAPNGLLSLQLTGSCFYGDVLLNIIDSCPQTAVS